MKKLLAIAAFLALSAPLGVFAAPPTTFTSSVVPISTDTYYLGTSSPSLLEWIGIFTKAIQVGDLGGSGTRCVQTDNNGLLSKAAAACGSGGAGGTPGGSDKQVQFNDAGGFGGDANLTFSKGTGLLTGLSSLFTFSTTTNFLATGSSTLQAFTFTNGTGTSATTTSFFATTASSTNLFGSLINGFGLLTCNGTTGALSWTAGKFGCGTIAPPASAITNGAALTKTDDTNVTLTLGGTPASALLQAVSITAGWTGTLADSRVADNLTISGGTVDNSIIGGTSAAAGTFTNLLATGSSTLQNFTGLNSTTTNATTTNVQAANAFYGYTSAATSTLLGSLSVGQFQTTNMDNLVSIFGQRTYTTGSTPQANAGMVNINNGVNTREALEVYQPSTDSIAAPSLTRIENANTSEDSQMLLIKSASTNAANTGLVIDSAGIPALYLQDRNQNNATGRGLYQISGSNDQFRVEGRNNTNTSFTSQFLLSSNFASSTGRATFFNGITEGSSRFSIFGTSTTAVAGVYTPPTNLFTLTSLAGATEGDFLAVKMATGNVGISTTSPYSKLSVGGDVVIGASSAGGTLGDLYIPNLAAGCAQVNSLGKITSTGVNCSTGGSGDPYPFQGTGNSTSTLTQFNNGLTAFSSSTISALTVTNGTTTNATSTNFSTSKASTTSLWISGTKSAILLTDINGAVSGYTGASACGANNFVTALSALGATTCGSSTISGIALGSNLASLSHDATFSGTSYNGSAAVSDWGINLATGNVWTAASTTFSGGVTITNGTTTNATSTNLSTTNASTTNLTVSGVKSALLLTNSAGTVSGYGGASACASNNFVTALSALGGTTCGSSTISGVALGGTLNALTATDATLTFSGSYDGSAARTVGINLTTGNVWNTASTTFSGGLTFTTGTSTSATSTNFFSTTASTSNLFMAKISGAGLASCSGATNALTYVSATLTFGCNVIASSGGGNSKFATTTSTKYPNAISPNGGNNTLLGLGTTTPAYQFQSSSSTGPQLGLTDASLTSDQWTFRNAGGNLYIATSSPTTNATSTGPVALTLNNTGQGLYIATSTAYATGSLLSIGPGSGGASATTTIDIAGKGCVNMINSGGTQSSFYINAASALVVEANSCK